MKMQFLKENKGNPDLLNCPSFKFKLTNCFILLTCWQGSFGLMSATDQRGTIKSHTKCPDGHLCAKNPDRLDFLLCSFSVKAKDTLAPMLIYLIPAEPASSFCLA